MLFLNLHDDTAPIFLSMPLRNSLFLLLKSKQKEWHPATKPLKIFLCFYVWMSDFLLYCTVYFCSMPPRKFCSDAAKMDTHTKTARKGLGLRWRLSYLLTKHLTMLSAQQKPYKLHAIARKRDLQKCPNSRTYCFHSQLHIILKSLD